MFLKRAVAVLSTMLLLAGLAACSGTSGGGADEKIIVKVSHAASTEDTRHQGALKFKEVVEKETGGQVEVQIYPASQLGNPTEAVEAMQAGTIEMVILPSAFLGGFQPLVTLLDLPFFLPENVDELLKVHKSDAVKQVLASTEEKGITTLGIWHTGYKQFSANKPLTKAEDFRGVKFRAMPSPVLIGQFRVVGADPINLPYSETYSALQTGAIDGQENPINTIYDMKFHEVQRYVTMSYHGTLDQLIMLNKAWFDKQSQSVKEAIVKGFEEGAKATFDATQKKEREDMETIKKTDTEIIELSPQERETLRQAFAKVQELYVQETGEKGKELLDLLKSALQ